MQVEVRILKNNILDSIIALVSGMISILLERMKILSTFDLILILIIISLIFVCYRLYQKNITEKNEWSSQEKKLQDKILELQKINISNTRIEIKSHGNSITMSSTLLKDKDAMSSIQQVQNSFNTTVENDTVHSQ